VGIWLLTALGAAGCALFGPSEPEVSPLLADHGVDVAERRIRIGALNDESGPARSIGHPFSVGKRILAARVNAGGTGLLPEGWTIELVERDHGYATDRATRALADIADDVLFVGTSFGTEHTVALQQSLTEADLVAFPASLSTVLQGHPLTPPLGASYEDEARRAVDFVVAQADGRPVRVAVVRQPDAYGEDVARGARRGARDWEIGPPLVLAASDGAEAIGARIVAEEVTHVILGTLPPLTAALLEDARTRQSEVAFVGATPAWSDALVRRPDAAALLARYHQTSSLPFWGEELPGMADFEAAFEAYAADEPEDSYVLVSWAHGVVQLEAAAAAIEAGDVTRAGFRRALAGLHAVDAGGLLGPFDLSRLPGPVTRRVRILEPRVGEGPRFEEALESARPGPRRGRPGQPAMDDEANVGSNPGEVTGELE